MRKSLDKDETKLAKWHEVELQWGFPPSGPHSHLAVYAISPNPLTGVFVRCANARLFVVLVGFLFVASPNPSLVLAQSKNPSLEELKRQGSEGSGYKQRSNPNVKALGEIPTADVEGYKKTIRPILRDACFHCHGENDQEGEFRVDTLNPDLIRGGDRSWWLEVFNVVSNGEMPPKDDDGMPASDRSLLVDWLSNELLVASRVARDEGGHSSFRRMTRYEYNYALQDLLGVPFDFAKDLPPETVSEDGFLNSSEMLQMTVQQFATYRDIAFAALQKTTVRGLQPEPVYYSITMDKGAEKQARKFELDLEKLKERFKDDPQKLADAIAKRKNSNPRGAHYKNLETGFTAAAKWSYSGARYAHKPVSELPPVADELPMVAVLPPGQKLIVDLGDHLPASGDLRLRIRAGRLSDESDRAAMLRVYFGHQASNNSRAEERVGNLDMSISNDAEESVFHEFAIPLGEVVRNPFRGIQPLGKTPNPAEYVALRNTSDDKVSIQIDYVEVTAPFFKQWPPESHQRIFGSEITSSEISVADDSVRKILDRFMTRAWRRAPTAAELDRKHELVKLLEPNCEDAQEAITYVLADVLSSPKFLYLVEREQSDDNELAARLATFLWSSLPDEQLLELASTGQLSDPATLDVQIDRMLADERGQRFSKHFVRQWLGMQLLDHLKMDEDLRAAMHEEPISFFNEVLKNDRSVIDFLHADYAVVNERLAAHYGIPNVQGRDFRRVSIDPKRRRGGLLTQAGLLAMNSDGKHSHPLKRGIWLLEKILNDPPPPPPPAVPEIDLADPEILKLTLKERMEDHRSDPACISCHQRIDPWGIAFENFDALGRWRDRIGKKPVDASSVLFNQQEIDGIDGLKRFLLKNRQDQFARALTHKMATYALGRPIRFADHAELDRITAQLRQQDDGLKTLVKLIVKSNLFGRSHSSTEAKSN